MKIILMVIKWSFLLCTIYIFIFFSFDFWMKCNLNWWFFSLWFTHLPCWGCLLTERKLVSKCSNVMNISTSRTLPPSCMYCLGELSLIVGTPANILLPSERDSARSSSRPPPRAKFLNIEERSQERWDQSIKHMNYSNLPYLAKTTTKKPYLIKNFGSQRML